MPAPRRITIICISVWPSLAWASVPSSIDASFVPHTQSLLGYAAIGVFVTAYLLVMLEDRLGLHKSIPVMLAGSIIWLLISMMTDTHGLPESGVGKALHHVLEEYGSLFLFLLVAMTYVNALTERGVFAVLRAWLINRHFSFRQIYWCTGFVAFVLSPVADNLTTALVMGAVVMTVGHGDRRFISLGAINIVVAANAGGAFSPFGDLTTLMIWEAGKVPTVAFGQLFVPAVVNYAVPALIMSTRLPSGRPLMDNDLTRAKPGAWFIAALFIMTIGTAITFEQVFHLPPYMGMMTGLAYLLLYGFIRDRSDHDLPHNDSHRWFNHIARAEWDTLLFFFGIIFSVGGLAHIGYLEWVASQTYETLGPTQANVIAGLLSAVVDNIPVMFGILSMDPSMSTFQWLLVTLTTGVGGSLLSIGSAAGVALMGQSNRSYTFVGHLRWSWAILLGYAASVYTHLLLNGG